MFIVHIYFKGFYKLQSMYNSHFLYMVLEGIAQQSTNSLSFTPTEM